jgi:hypothetical protein
MSYVGDAWSYYNDTLVIAKEEFAISYDVLTNFSSILSSISNLNLNYYIFEPFQCVIND